MESPTAPSLTLDASLAVCDHVLAREFDGAMTMLNSHSEQYFSLDDVGTLMWDAIVQTQTLREAHARLMEQFDVGPEQLEGDLLVFGHELVEQGLLAVVEADGDSA